MRPHSLYGIAALLVALGGAAPCAGWETVSLASHGRMWSEWIPDNRGCIALGRSNEVQFAGLSNYSSGGSPDSPVYAIIRYGTFVDQIMSPGYPIHLDQYLYQRGLPTALDLAADTNDHRAVAYSVHTNGQVAIRCALQVGASAWLLEQVVAPLPLAPDTDHLWLDSAMATGQPSIAHLHSADGTLRWSVRHAPALWITETVATSARGPVTLAMAPQGIPTIAFVSDDRFRWAYRVNGTWNVETIASGRVVCAALGFDRNGAVSVAYRLESNSNLLYATRGTFGGWTSQIVSTPSGHQALSVDLEFNPDNAPTLAYSDGLNAFFAQRVSPTQWRERVAAASTCGLGGCFYSWQYMGQDPDLLYLRDGSPIILHHGYSGNYKISSQARHYYTSWAPMREVPRDWIYHDDADGIEDRSTVPITPDREYALNQTEALDHDDIEIRMITPKPFFDIGGQMWVRWWNGSSALWAQGFPERHVALSSGALNGQPTGGAVTVTLWRCVISSAWTQPGVNYYAIQVKVGSELPLGDVAFDEDWLLRDADGTTHASINNIGQSISEIAEYYGHDWAFVIRADADADGMSDGWEQAYGLSSSNALDALIDVDGDGVSNRDEYLAQTDPTSATSYFAIESCATEGGAIALSFWGSTNRLYTLESGTPSAAGDGTPIATWQADAAHTRVRGSNGLQRAIASSTSTGAFIRINAQFP